MHCIIHEEFWLVLQILGMCCLPNILFAFINIAFFSSSEIVSVESSDDSTVECDVADVGICSDGGRVIGCGGFSFTAPVLIGIVLVFEILVVDARFFIGLRCVVIEVGV